MSIFNIYRAIALFYIGVRCVYSLNVLIRGVHRQYPARYVIPQATCVIEYSLRLKCANSTSVRETNLNTTTTNGNESIIPYELHTKSKTIPMFSYQSIRTGTRRAYTLVYLPWATGLQVTGHYLVMANGYRRDLRPHFLK